MLYSIKTLFALYYNQMILLISYDLIGRERPSEYERFTQVIKDNAGEGNYVKALYSQWFVETTKTIGEWNDMLRAASDDNDSRMIVRLYAVPVGRYSAAAVDWINTKF